MSSLMPLIKKDLCSSNLPLSRQAFKHGFHSMFRFRAAIAAHNLTIWLCAAYCICIQTAELLSNSFLLSLPLVIKDQCTFRRQTVFASRLSPLLRCYFFLPLSLSLSGEWIDCITYFFFLSTAFRLFFSLFSGLKFCWISKALYSC